MHDAIARALATAGVIAPEVEAAALITIAGRDGRDLDELVRRRVAGEPFAWVVGRTRFCGIDLLVDPGVYVPRPQTEALALRAVELLPPEGVAIDLCTGTGAIAVVLRSHRPTSRVVATDIDPAAIGCARRNGVDAYVGDLDAPLPEELKGRADVLTAVVPYVPTDRLHLLPRDALAYEPRHALDGGDHGTAFLLRVTELAPRWLRPGGALLAELGGDQAATVDPALRENGFTDVTVLRDDDGADRGIEARFTTR